MRTIALEEPFLAECLQRATGASNSGANSPLFAQRAALEEKLLDVGEGRLADMHRASIDFQVLSHEALGFSAINPANATSLVRDINDELAGKISRHPTHLGGFAAL